MVNIDCLFLGYCRFFTEENSRSEVADLLLKNGICAKFDTDGSFVLPLRRVRRAKGILVGCRGLCVSGVQGVPGFFLRYRRRYGVFFALLLLFLFFAFSGGRVWDVRIEGDGEIPSAAVTEELAAVGLTPGVKFSDLDFSALETELLRRSPRVAWLNINRRGNVAYVKVASRAQVPKKEQTGTYANIVADEDALIEEITVRLGTETVRVGDTVRKGDLLISGIGGGLVSAEGSVRGRVKRTVEVTVPYTESVVVHGERKSLALSVNFFGFSLNILKIYGNPPPGCDIIEETEHLTLFGLVRLPIVIRRTVGVSRTETHRSYTADECAKIAAARLSSLVRRELSDGDLLKIRTGGAFTEEGYSMYAEITEVREIGRRAEFGSEGG